MKVRLFRPYIGKEELENIKDAFDRAWIGLGPNVRLLEEKWSAFIGVKKSVAVNSCTAALHLALSVYKFPPGKKVLVPALTFASTAMAAIYNRLVPVFVDSDETTLGISLEDLEGKADVDCVAVIPVHYCGHPVPMDRLNAFAGRHNLKVIEDCAHTAGGKYKNRSLGTWGDIGCFSFEEKKCMTTGDGGMICSDDAVLLSSLPAARWVGINKDTWQRTEANTGSSDPSASSWYYEIHDTGYKYNMNDLAASIGLAQLERIDELNSRRRQVIARYLEGIRQTETVRIGLPYELEDSSYQMFILRVRDRNRFIRHMKEAGIDTGVHYLPLHLHPYFSQFNTDTPVINATWEQLVTIPLHAALTDEEVDHVINTINNYDRK
jgi:perosamine synthetase